MYAIDSFDFTHNGTQYRGTVVPDEFMGPPWEEHDGHGPVSEWTTRAKHPGEIVLCEDRHAKRYYDFQEACRIARKDGWDAKPYNEGQETKRQQAAKAARADFKNLQDWCDGRWQWVGVTLQVKCPCCGEYRDTGQSLWGIDSPSVEYHREVAEELADEYEYTQEVA